MKSKETLTYRVVDFLQKHAGEVLSITEIAKALDADAHRVSTAIANKRSENEDFRRRLSRPETNHVKYDSDGILALTKRVDDVEANLVMLSRDFTIGNAYTQIGMTRDGAIILQDVDGILFRATELA
jgi:hypothetical protein